MTKSKINEYGMTRGAPTPVGSQPNVKAAPQPATPGRPAPPAATIAGATSTANAGATPTSKSSPAVDKKEFQKGFTVMDKDGNEIGQVVSAVGEVPKPDVVIIKTPDGKLETLDDTTEYHLQTESIENLPKNRRFLPKMQGAIMKASYKIEHLVDELEDRINQWGEIDVPDDIRKKFAAALNSLIALSKTHGIAEDARFAGMIKKLRHKGIGGGKHTSKAKKILGKYSPKLGESRELTKILDLPFELQIKRLDRIVAEDIDQAWIESKQIIRESQSEDHANGTYSSYIVDSKTKKNILKWCEDNDIECNTKDKLHCTIVFSKTPAPDLIEYNEKPVDITAKATGWELFGENKDCLVLKIENSEINDMHETMLEAGASHSYDKFVPHITFNSDYGGDIPKSLPEFDIRFDVMEVTPLEDDYYDADKEDIKEGAVPENNVVRSLKKLMSQKICASDIKKQMSAYFAIPDPNMLSEFRAVRGSDGDNADLRPVLKSYIETQLHPSARAQL